MRMSERHSGAVTMGTTIRLCSAGIAAAALTVSVTAHGVHSDDNQSSAWTVARPVEEVNSVAADGCPIESHDGLSLYFASMRAGTLGGNDIWAADRASKDAPFGEPQNLGAPVNSTASDFCPTPIHGS